MDALCHQFDALVKGIVGDTSLEAIEFAPALSDAHKADLSGLFNQITIDQNQVLTTLILNQCHQLNLSSLGVNENLQHIIVLHDISIYFDEQSPDGCFLMQCFYSITVNNTILDQELFDKFSSWFFNPANDFRLLKLTRGNTLLGKARPGSKLLSLFNQIDRIIQNFLPNNLTHLNQYRSLILNSFEINDKLSKSLDWSMNNSLKHTSADNLNKFFGVIEELSKDLPNFMLQFNQGINRNVVIIRNTLTKLKSIPVEKDNLCFDLQWLPDLANQLKFENKFQTFVIQMLIIFNSICNMQHAQIDDLIKRAQFEFPKKFKLPAHLSYKPNNNTPAATNKRSADLLRDLKRIIIQLKSMLPEEYVSALTYSLDDNEKTWTLMKLKSFNHPQVEAINHIYQENEQSPTIKLESYLQSHNSSKITKFRVPKSKLSKLINHEPILDSLKNSIDQNKLDDIKDEIYMTRGQLEASSEDTSETKQKLNHLIWKEAKLERDNGILNMDVEF